MALLASTRLEAIKSCPLDCLTIEEGVKRLQIFGPNKLEEKKVFINTKRYDHN